MTSNASWPKLAADLPKVDLLQGKPRWMPSGAALPLAVWDTSTVSSVYGGNKVAKLEWILGQAVERGVSDILTVGAVGSHHAIATALHARSVGIRTHALVFAQPDTPHVRANAAAMATLCASVSAAPKRRRAVITAIRAWLRVRRGSGRRPLFVPPGGSSPVGTVGWVEQGLRLASLCDEHRAQRVVVALGSGGTAAGLWLGLWEGGFRGELVAVRVVDRFLANGPAVRSLARLTQAHLRSAGVELSWPQRPVRIEGDWFCGGYGRTDERVTQAVARGQDAGLPTESTYTGKALGAALQLSRDGVPTVLVHTASAVEPPGSGVPPALEALLRR